MLDLKESFKMISIIDTIKDTYKYTLEDAENTEVKDVYGSELKEYSIANQKYGFLEGIKFACEALELNINFDELHKK